jgi:hypothetical protein
MQEHTVDFPGFSTAPAGTEPSFSTALTSPPGWWTAVGSVEFHAAWPQAPAVRDTIDAFRRGHDRRAHESATAHPICAAWWPDGGHRHGRPRGVFFVLRCAGRCRSHPRPHARPQEAGLPLGKAAAAAGREVRLGQVRGWSDQGARGARGVFWNSRSRALMPAVATGAP